VSVAVIDDHELVRQGLASLLAGAVVAGRQVEVVYAGGSVSAGIEARPDIGLLDVDLGPESAPVDQAVGELLEAGSRVLMISAYDDARSIKAGLEAGALGFVPKRVSLEVLVEALSTVYTDELYLSVDLASILAAAVETPDLSPRESEALRLYASGLSMTAVARRLEISRTRPRSTSTASGRSTQPWDARPAPARSCTRRHSQTGSWRNPGNPEAFRKQFWFVGCVPPIGDTKR